MCLHLIVLAGGGVFFASLFGGKGCSSVCVFSEFAALKGFTWHSPPFLGPQTPDKDCKYHLVFRPGSPNLRREDRAEKIEQEAFSHL